MRWFSFFQETWYFKSVFANAKLTRLGCFYVTAILSRGWVEVNVEVEVELRFRLRLSWGWNWGWVEVELRYEVKVEVEVELRLGWGWGWDEVESKLSWHWVEVDLSLGWDKLKLNKGRNWAFIGLGLWFKICFRSTHAAEQHTVSMSPSIFAFDFI